MKAVMISIQPKWCELIANKKKTIEVRKTKPKIDVPFKCYIYCTNTFYRNGLYPKDVYWLNNKIANGKVIGEFVCDMIDIIPKHRHCDCNPFDSTADCEICKPRKELCKKSCLCGQETIDYLGYDEIGYAWHITDLVIYDKPKELREFYSGTVCKDYWGGNSGCDDSCGIAENNECKWGHTALHRPPQSWQYVEELKE